MERGAPGRKLCVAISFLILILVSFVMEGRDMSDKVVVIHSFMRYCSLLGSETSYGLH